MNLGFDDFLDELTECGWRPVHDDGNAKLRALWQSWQPDGYDASCIRVLGGGEALAMTPWLAPETLAAKYGKDVDFIRRGLQACRNADVDIGYFVRRYLEGDRSVPKNDSVEYQARVLQGLLVENGPVGDGAET